MDLVSCGRRNVARLLLVLAMIVVASVHGGGRLALAGLPEGLGNQASTLPGIEQAIGRFYYGANGSYLAAFVFRFDRDASAVAGLDALDPGYANASWDQYRVTIDSLGSQTRAYHSVIFDDDSTDILTQAGVYVYVVTVDAYDPEIDSVNLASETITAMLEAGASDGSGAYQQDGTSTGGPWDVLPPGDGQAPVGFWVEYDDQYYPELPETTDEETDPDAFDFAALEGIQRAVTRSYTGDTFALESPETAPSAPYYLTAFVGEFDNADHAEAALEPLYTDLLASFDEDASITMESVDPGDIGDRAIANYGTTEEDGVTYELAVISVQADAYIHVVFVLGVGTDSGSMETATAVVEAMTDAEAGSGDGEYDESGTFLTGGLWDKFPADGDAVLNGLSPETDEQVYP